MATKGTDARAWYYGTDAVAKHYADTLAVLDLLIAQSEAASKRARELTVQTEMQTQALTGSK